jgi:hypothetical protein
MRWLCFLLAPDALAQAPRPPAKPLRFDLAALPVTRDSFVFRVRRVEGRRRTVGRKAGVTIAPIRVQLPAGAVWSSYQWFAAPGLAASAGDSLVGKGYSEFGDSVETLVVVAEAVRTIQVPAGQFVALPLVAGGMRIYVSRMVPRRVVKGETPDGTFTFELVHSGPPVPVAEP